MAKTKTKKKKTPALGTRRTTHAPAATRTRAVAARRAPTPPSSRLSLSSPLHSVEIRVRDVNLEVVARGFGKMDEQLPPGIYQVEYRAGSNVRRELVALRANETFAKHDVELLFASPVPLEGTSTSRETYQRAVERLSRKPTKTVRGDSGFLIFIRNLDKNSGFKMRRESVRNWQLLDSHLRPVLDLPKLFQTNVSEEWMGLSVLLPAGGYVLRVSRGIDDQRPFDQALWLSRGWTTGLFIAQNETGPVPEAASVQMTKLKVGWEAFMENSHQVVRIAELALTGLREGRQAVPAAQLSQLLHAKFENPMLGILGAHALLLQRNVNCDTLGEVIGNLDALLPGHPDVMALRQMSAKLLGVSPPASGNTMPPMLLASYTGLLARDAQDEGVIPAASLAESIAPSLLRQGTWTSWRPLSTDQVARVSAVAIRSPFRTTLSRGFAQSKALEIQSVRAVPEAAIQRVKRYIDEIQKFSLDEGPARPISSLPVSQVSSDTSLPASMVKTILRSLQLNEGKLAASGEQDSRPAVGKVITENHGRELTDFPPSFGASSADNLKTPGSL